MSNPLHIVILAAGEGTRMKSSLPKVLQSVGGRPMLAHLLETAQTLEPARVHVVVGAGADRVQAACGAFQVDWVLQKERRGTGHAVLQAMPSIPDDAEVLVLLGDHPLIPSGLLAELVDGRDAPLSLLTMELDEPTGYGRVLRDVAGRVCAVVEERDATQEQRAVREVNTGIVLADAGALRRWLGRLDCDNVKGEYYLTDIFAMARGEGLPIRGLLAPDPRDLQGANDRRQIALLEERFRERAAGALMDEGVSIADPRRVDVRARVTAGSDVTLDINVVLEGDVRLGDGSSIGPGCVVRDCDLAAGTRVHPYSVLEGVRTTGACDIGPFARLRPGTELSSGCKVGNFVEAKNARLGEGSKASHLTYLGDSEIGRNVNIGAGTITCNYDGANKHRTTIEDDAFIGSNSALVAPVTVHRGATVGAGSTLTKDAPEDALTISRARQATVRGWKRPHKKDTER
ncbi:MAG: bifunctional UDP-N-acetylglucosamine diphosphorylase/glucosamine-1-phosphate N-acetyltransferase GlmU [Lysobacterales bacterium]|jgi:bifunctional UDP-N-acetylglucosamine pyrophosphorylase/glucosamine-1-phosphate N-acetyltransferase